MSELSSMANGAEQSRHITRRQFLKRAAAIGIAVPAVGSLLAACGGGGTTSGAPTSASGSGGASPTSEALPTTQIQTSSGTPQASSGTPKRGGTMTWVAHQEIAGLSPNDTGPSDQWDMITQIHNALVEMDENYVFQPTLAEKFEVASDGLTYTFTLRQGVTFHDGTEFSSADVKYTFDFYSNASNGSVIANDFENMGSVEATDPSTVTIKMSAPNAAFVARGASTFIVQSKYHAQVGEKKYRTAPIGTGAYKLKEWVAADHTTVEAFDQHFRGRPNIDTIIEKNVPEPSVRKIALETGTADSSVWPLLVQDDLQLNKETDKFTSFTSVSVAVNHFPINNQRPFFADKQLRQALLYAIDRQQVINTVFKGAAVLATGNLAPALKAWYNPNVATYSYDPAKAKSMLDAAGWKAGSDGIRAKNGQRFSFTCYVISGDQARKPEAELVQQFLKAVGVEMNIQEQPVTTINQQLLSGKGDAALFNWTYGGDGGDPDATDTLRSNGGSNFSHYNNPQVDQLLDQGLEETDTAKRKQIYDQIQTIFADDVPFLYMMYWQWFNHVTKRIQGLPKSALSGGQLYRKAYQWWIA